MTHKRAICISLFLFLAVVGAAGGFWWAVVQVPDFYQQALGEEPDPVVRKAAAKVFVQRTLRLVDDIKQTDRWAEEFEQKQINSWLAEDLQRKFSDILPEGVRDPRLKLTKDAILVGFRFRYEGFNGIVSLRLKPWMAAPNRLAVEFVSIKAGLVPIPLDEILAGITEQLAESGWKTRWTRANGNDVLIIDLDQGEPEQPVLEAIELLDGVIRIAGSGKGVSAGDHSSLKSPRLADQSVKK